MAALEMRLHATLLLSLVLTGPRIGLIESCLSILSTKDFYRSGVHPHAHSTLSSSYSNFCVILLNKVSDNVHIEILIILRLTTLNEQCSKKTSLRLGSTLNE